MDPLLLHELIILICCVIYHAVGEGKKLSLCTSQRHMEATDIQYDSFFTSDVDGYKQWRTQEFCLGGGSTNSVEDRGQRERGSGGGRPLVWVFLN